MLLAGQVGESGKKLRVRGLTRGSGPKVKILYAKELCGAAVGGPVLRKTSSALAPLPRMKTLLTPLE
jgi:hypothetical protein